MEQAAITARFDAVQRQPKNKYQLISCRHRLLASHKESQFERMRAFGETIVAEWSDVIRL